jgi:hypothetical protein
MNMAEYNLKITRFIVLLSITFILLISCEGEKVESQKIKSSITIDGIADDWSEYRQFYNEDWKTMYSIINDDTSISVLIQFRDNQLARKINTRGFTLWLNSEGDEDKNWGIHYEDRELMDKLLNEIAEAKRFPNNENREPAMNKSIEFKGTFSLIGENKNILSDNGQNGIYAGAFCDQGSYCFEYKILFNSDLFKIAPDSDLKFGIELAAVSEEFKEIMQRKMLDRKKGGMREGGVMRGGGRRGREMGGAPGGGKDNMMNDMETQEFWFSLELAK